jgi:hypothetical protein
MSSASTASAVPRADGRHRDHFAVDELDAIVLGQDAGLAHSPVLVRRKALLVECERHERIPIPASGKARTMPLETRQKWAESAASVAVFSLRRGDGSERNLHSQPQALNGF